MLGEAGWLPSHVPAMVKSIAAQRTEKAPWPLEVALPLVAIAPGGPAAATNCLLGIGIHRGQRGWRWFGGPTKKELIAMAGKREELQSQLDGERREAPCRRTASTKDRRQGHSSFTTST